MKVVLDTNVFISGIIWRGNPYRCLLAAEAGLYELVLAEKILEELRTKLVEKFRHTDDEAADILDRYRKIATMVNLTGQTGLVPADPDDDKFVEAATIASADAIVSGDRHLLDLELVQGIPILSCTEFLRLLAQQGLGSDENDQANM